MADRFYGAPDRASAPARKSIAVVAHDSNPLADICNAIYVGTGGNITCRLVDDTSDRVLKNVASGSFFPAQFQYIRATGTTAADIVAFV